MDHEDEDPTRVRVRRGPRLIEGDDILVDYPHLVFPAASDEYDRLLVLRQMDPRPNTVICWRFIDDCGERAPTEQIIGVDTPWSRLFTVPHAAHRELTLECYSTIRVRYHFLFS